MGASVVGSMLAIVYSHDILFDGIVWGFVYALVAIGLVLIYRATGVLNFAHGQIGVFGGYVMALMFVNYSIPYWLSFPIALAAGAAIGAITELALRRLFDQPRLLLFVATLGVTQAVLLAQLLLPDLDNEVFTTFPTPWKSQWNDVGGTGISVRGAQLLVLIAVPLIVALLAYLLQRTKLGLSIRATADNPSAASLGGISVRNVSTQVWVIAGILSAVSAMLIAPVQLLDAGSVQRALGPQLLLLALAAALFGRLRSFPMTLVGGVIIGVVDRLVTQNWGSGTSKLVVFVLVLVLVLVLARSDPGDDWSFNTRLRAGAEDLRQHRLYKVLSWGGVALLGLIAALAPQFFDKTTDWLRYAEVMVFLIVALSATVLTGWGGQLSLGQYGFAAIGGYMTVYYAAELPFLVALALGVACGAIVAIVIGIPALRIKGLYLAVITLGFALAIEGWFVKLDRISAEGKAKLAERPKIGPIDVQEHREHAYWLILAALVVVLFLVTQLRRSGVGRSMIAVRDNENSAAAYTINPIRAKLIAFATSGGIAALAGGLLPLTNAANEATFLQFSPDQSLRVIAVAVIGGISSVPGAVLGTLLVIGLPTMFEGTEQVNLFASGIGMLIVLLYFPGGLISIVHNARDMLLAGLAKRSGWEPRKGRDSAEVGELSARAADDRAAPGTVALEASGVTVRFGGRIAVDNVDLTVLQGEVVGLIGTNGAGKTTLMNAISGIVPSKGEVRAFGVSLDGKAPHVRARLGVGRAFQNAKLFGALSVREALMVALEGRERSLLLPSLLSLPPSPRAERRKKTKADEIITYLGLGRYADSLLADLSTGTRRIVELGALIALDTKIMLLDEPTAGVAQKETEAFGPLIRQIQSELGSSILVIEHDMPMVMSISDRIYCLEAGQVIAEGTPSEVRNDPAVIASYLGTDARAIDRSDS